MINKVRDNQLQDLTYHDLAFRPTLGTWEKMNLLIASKPQRNMQSRRWQH